MGAGTPGREENPASGEGRGPGDSLRCAPVPASGRAGEEEEGRAAASKGIFLSRLESDAGGSVLLRPLPGDGNLLHFPGAGSPTLPPTLAPLPASARPPRLHRTPAALPPLFGERQPHRKHLGARVGAGGPAAARALSNT